MVGISGYERMVVMLFYASIVALFGFPFATINTKRWSEPVIIIACGMEAMKTVRGTLISYSISVN
jgi:hypothetical protein